jgi:hypothetical protein
MSAIPLPLAGRLDRLSRHAHRFHRFAHHPMCAEYAGEVIRFGRRTRVCRGCSLVLAGALSGGMLALVLPLPLILASLVLMISIWVLAYVTFARRWRMARPSKVVARFLPALGIGYALGGALLGGGMGPALFFSSCLLLLWLVAVYRRRGPDRSPCVSCPERWQAAACRGVSPIVRRERAFRRLAGHWLARAGL